MEKGNVLGRHWWQSEASSGDKGEPRCLIDQLEMGRADKTALEECERGDCSNYFSPKSWQFQGGIHGSPQPMMTFNKVYGANPLPKPFPWAERNCHCH